MCRWIAGIVKLPDESWVEYIERATRRSEELFGEHRSTAWVALQPQQKWRFTDKTAQQTDNGWSTKLFEWRP